MKLVECVPNFSTSDRHISDSLSRTCDKFEGVKVLNVEADADYNRTVFTFVARLDNVVNVCIELIQTALELIDMREHQGEHPRLGAVDVFPLIPLEETSFQECINAARDIGKEIGISEEIPVFLYGKAAIDSNRTVLSDIRRGEYEGLTDKLKQSKWQPDFGPSIFVPKSGAMVIGVRNILIAYNVNLATSSEEIANKIARRIRSTGGKEIKDGKKLHISGLLQNVQAMSVTLTRGERTFCQVSTNVLDYREGAGLHDVFDAVEKVGQDFNTKVTGSELVGLAPLEAILDAGRHYSKSSNTSEKDLVNIAVDRLGLDDLSPFNPKEKIIEYLLRED